MTISIEQLRRDLAAVRSELAAQTGRVERENGYIGEAVRKVQSAFGDQRPGQQAVMELTRVIYTLASAQAALDSACGKIENAIHIVEK